MFETGENNMNFIGKKPLMGIILTSLVATSAPIQAISAGQIAGYFAEAHRFLKYALWKNLVPSYAKVDETINQTDAAMLPTAEQLAQNIKTALGGQADSFLIGASTSEHQCSKQCTPERCNWARFAQQRKLKQPTDKEYTCDFWNNYETYIPQLKKECNINTLRFSLERALVETFEGYFDEAALRHYTDMFVHCLKHDITPLVCFHHYTDPCWLADKNGFEVAENNQSFAWRSL